MPIRLILPAQGATRGWSRLCPALLAIAGLALSVPAKAQYSGSGETASPSPSSSSTDPAGFADYVRALGRRAVADGVRPQTVAMVSPSVVFLPNVVRLDRAQGVSSAKSAANPRRARLSGFAAYRRGHVDAVRIRRGQARYRDLRPFLASVEAETGVPESIMVSIWGNETSYGAVVGSTDLPSALATLAFEGRRRAMFEEEYIAALKIIDRGTPRSTLKGSWAGATGHPQFMPTAYIRVARDGNRDGRIDIWTTEADGLASIANYFLEAGWKAGEHWGVAVSVPAGLDREALATRLTSPRCTRTFQPRSRWLTVREWQALGVVPTGRTLPPQTLAVLLEPDGPGATGYLVTGNYQVILDYNCSNFYALSVGLLADAVGN